MKKTPESIIDQAKKLCEKFVNKVETGRARSVETYKECKDLLLEIKKYEKSIKSKGENHGKGN